MVACRMISVNPVTEINAVSFKDDTHTFPSPGRANRRIWGAIILWNTSQDRIPIALAASISPFGKAKAAPLKTSVVYAPEMIPTE